MAIKKFKIKITRYVKNARLTHLPYMKTEAQNKEIKIWKARKSAAIAETQGEASSIK